MSFTISFSRLGNFGRLGNQLFEIAGTIGLAEHYNAQAAFPLWQYESWFDYQFPHGSMQSNLVKEKYFHYHDWGLTGDTDILGYLQSEKYFAKDFKNQFRFKEDVIYNTRNRMPAELFDKKTILLQIRRGDYVDNPNYYQLSIDYYIDALLTYFPDWQDCNIVFFSDDLSYCKVHFECLPNAYFTDGLSDMEQLVLATQMDNYIIPNSSFGWWCAWLGEAPGKKIIHCGHLQNGKLLQENNPKDYYPERWKRHQKEKYKIELPDVTITIPVLYDHEDRKRNLDLALCMLQKSFEVKIIIGEQGANNFEYTSKWCQYMRFENMVYFHRTKMLNDMANMATTKYLINYDCDVILPPMQIYLTVLMLRKGYDMVFPYDGRFSRWERGKWLQLIEKSLDIGVTAGFVPRGSSGKDITGEYSVGGAVAWNKDSFIDGGMENEFMISFGPEDCERNDRFTTLEYKIGRTGGALYHIDHWRGPDSSPGNPFFKANHVEIERIRKMNKKQMQDYIDTWPWRKKYTVSYFRRIEQGAVNSAKEVYYILDIPLNAKILDVGCGIGEWCCGFENYFGIDNHDEISILTFDKSNYIQMDFEKNLFKYNKDFDLVLCLEVGEHISESRADALVEALCSAGDNILFSAAIPNQGGTGHVNEQWQSWWAEKFDKNGFYPINHNLIENIRKNKKIEMWYKQNMVYYAGKASKDFMKDAKLVSDFVLPEYYLEITKGLKWQLEAAEKKLK